jgi:hypothetical protein
MNGTKVRSQLKEQLTKFSWELCERVDEAACPVRIADAIRQSSRVWM